MGFFYKTWFIVSLIFSLLLYSMAHGSKSYDPESLRALFHSHVNETLAKHHHTGHFYNISLPSNFSGMQVSVVRLRSGTLEANGANFSCFHIPPKVIPVPYEKRIAIVYDNLGNWSSHYYKVQNHSLVAPVVGFTPYDASNLSNLSNRELTLSMKGDPISISFSDIVIQDKNVTLKCVKFGAGESIEFSNMAEPNLCVTRGPGHFSVVTPSPPQPPEKKGGSSRKWWVVGFVSGFGGLVLLILVGVVIFKLVRKRKLRKMESESEKGVAFDTMWIGRSRIPSASMIRTQPALEHDYVP